MPRVSPLILGLWYLIRLSAVTPEPPKARDTLPIPRTILTASTSSDDDFWRPMLKLPHVLCRSPTKDLLVKIPLELPSERLNLFSRLKKTSSSLLIFSVPFSPQILLLM